MKYIVRIEFRMECGCHDTPCLDENRIIPQFGMDGDAGIQLFESGCPDENSRIAANIKKRDVDRSLAAVDLPTVSIAGNIRG